MLAEPVNGVYLRGYSGKMGGYIPLKLGACDGETGSKTMVVSNFKNLKFLNSRTPFAIGIIELSATRRVRSITG